MSLRGKGPAIEEARRVRNAAIIDDAATMTKRQLEKKYGMCFSGIGLILKQAGVEAVYDRSHAGKNIIYNWKKKKVRVVNETHLICTRCEVQKPIDAFYDRGFICRECTTERATEWNRKNKDRRSEISKKYASENRDENNAKSRAYYHRTTEKQVERRKVYYSKNKETLKNKALKWQLNRLKTNRSHRIKVTLRERIWRVLKGVGGKNNKSEWLMGISHAGFMKYIEAQFRDGMTWENYGHRGWRLDHVRPCASFPDLSDIEQQKQCFHYTNYQPLWALDNLRKSKKWNPENKIDSLKIEKSEDVIDIRVIEGSGKAS